MFCLDVLLFKVGSCDIKSILQVCCVHGWRNGITCHVNHIIKHCWVKGMVLEVAAVVNAIDPLRGKRCWFPHYICVYVHQCIVSPVSRAAVSCLINRSLWKPIRNLLFSFIFSCSFRVVCKLFWSQTENFWLQTSWPRHWEPWLTWRSKKGILLLSANKNDHPGPVRKCRFKSVGKLIDLNTWEFVRHWSPPHGDSSCFPSNWGPAGGIQC